MKIIQETPVSIVLKKSGLDSIIFGILSTGLGLFVLFIPAANVSVAKLIGAAFTLVGIYMIVKAEQITITLDKNTNNMLFLISSLLGKKSQTIPFQQMKEVSVRSATSTNTSSNGNTTTTTNYFLEFFAVDGEVFSVPLNSGFNFIQNNLPFALFSNGNNYVELGNKVAAFMGVPFVKSLPPSTGQILSTISDAIQGKSNMNEDPDTMGQQPPLSTQTPPPQNP